MLSVILLISLGAAEFKVRDMGELKVVWEREFDFDVEDAIVDSYGNLKVVVGKDRVVWFNQKGKEQADYRFWSNYHSARVTKNKKFILVSEMNERAEMKVFNDSGELLWEITGLNPYVTGVGFLSPNGKWLVIRPAWENDPIYFYYEGELTKEITHEEMPGHCTTIEVDFSPDGKYCVFYVANGWLMKFDSLGNEIWRLKLPDVNYYRGLSYFNNFIVAAGTFASSVLKSKIFIVSLGGKILSSFEVSEGSYKFKLIKDKLIARSVLHTLYLIDMKQKRLVWEYKGKGIWGDVFIKDTLFYIISSLQRKPYLLEINLKQKVLNRGYSLSEFKVIDMRKNEIYVFDNANREVKALFFKEEER